MNVFSDEAQYIEEAQKQADAVFVARIITADGTPGYHLFSVIYFRGQLEIKAGQLCKTKGYKVLREETAGLTERGSDFD